MSTNEIKCPKCGAPSAKNLKPDLYVCNYCGSEFHIIRPDIVRSDVVGHNCPICGKPVEAGKGFTCQKCKKFDLCEDCADKGPGAVYMCRDCLTAAGVACNMCGKLGYIVCGSCKRMAERGAIPKEDITQTCEACQHFAFEGSNYNRSGRIPVVEKLHFTCPSCGQICAMCAEEKKERVGLVYYCKNCGSKVSTFVIGTY